MQKNSSEYNWKALAITLVVLLIGTVVIVLLFAWAASKKEDLTTLEGILINFVMALLTVAIGWFFSAHYSRQQFQSSQIAIATLAIRRIDAARATTRRIRANIERKLYTVSKNKVTKVHFSEYLTDIKHQVVELAQNVQDSMKDWQDTLPEDFEASHELSEAIVGRLKVFQEIQEEMDEEAEDKDRKIKELTEHKEKLEKKIDEIEARSPLATTITGTASLLPLSGSQEPFLGGHDLTTYGSIGSLDSSLVTLCSICGKLGTTKDCQNCMRFVCPDCRSEYLGNVFCKKCQPDEEKNDEGTEKGQK